MPTARYDLAAVTGLDGRIYAMGGLRQDGTNKANTVEAYDPSTNTWSAVSPMPTARGSLAAAIAPNGRIYAIGGCSCSGGAAFVPLNAVEAYTPAASPTSKPTASPAPRVAVSSMVSPVPGQPGAAEASFTVSFSSDVPGQGEVYFGSGPGCLGLVEVATVDLHLGSTRHTVVVTGNDLPGTAGNNGIIPGVSYWFEVATVTHKTVEVDNNNGNCYSVMIPPS
jgi:hypothetical protein